MKRAPSLIVVTGPTASGKTAVSIEFAKWFGGEIVNADSVQVYKDFNIGSAKPSEEELGQVPHHLISEIDPKDNFDAEQFRRLANEKVEEISSRNHVPVISGGTGLYLRSLLCGLLSLGEIDPKAQEKLDSIIAELEAEGLNQEQVCLSLHQRLSEVDSKSALRIHRNDIQRLKRALLVNFATGESLVNLQEAHAHHEREHRALVVVLSPPKEELNKKINARVKQMLGSGLIDEVKSLLARYPLNSRPFGAIGYRHVAQSLNDDFDYEKMVEVLKRDTRHFAKRQRTWWRNQPRFLGWENVGDIFSGSVFLGGAFLDSAASEECLAQEKLSGKIFSESLELKLRVFLKQFMCGEGVFAVDEKNNASNKPVYFFELEIPVFE